MPIFRRIRALKEKLFPRVPNAVSEDIWHKVMMHGSFKDAGGNTYLRDARDGRDKIVLLNRKGTPVIVFDTATKNRLKNDLPKQ